MSHSMDKLTIEEVEKIKQYCSPLNGQHSRMAHQLADTMRENEQLRSVLETCDCGAAEAISSKDSANPTKTSD